MRRIADLVLHNLRLLASDRAALVWLLVMPVAFTFFTGLAFRGGGGGESPSPEELTFYVTVLNLDRGDRGRELVEAIEDESGIGVIAEEPLPDGSDADRVKELVADGERSSALIIPAGFSDSLAAGRQAVLEFVRNPERLNPHKTREAIDRVVARMNVSVSAGDLVVDARTALRGKPSDDRARALRDSARGFVDRAWSTPPVTVSAETLGRTGSSDGPVMGFAHASPAMALMFILLNGLMMSSVLVEERRERTLRRLFTTPTRRSQIIVANLVWRFLVGAGQLIFLIILGRLLFGVDWGAAPLGLAAVGAAYIAAVAGLSVLIGSWARNSRQAESLSLLLALSMCALGGLWWPLEITPRGYQIVGHMVPTGWAMDALHDIVSRGYGLAAVSDAALVLAGFAAAFTVAAALSFRPE